MEDVTFVVFLAVFVWLVMKWLDEGGGGGRRARARVCPM